MDWSLATPHFSRRGRQTAVSPNGKWVAGPRNDDPANCAPRRSSRSCHRGTISQPDGRWLAIGTPGTGCAKPSWRSVRRTREQGVWSTGGPRRGPLAFTAVAAMPPARLNYVVQLVAVSREILAALESSNGVWWQCFNRHAAGDRVRHARDRPLDCSVRTVGLDETRLEPVGCVEPFRSDAPRLWISIRR